jgi:hypothetical protein
MEEVLVEWGERCEEEPMGCMRGGGRASGSKAKAGAGGARSRRDSGKVGSWGG